MVGNYRENTRISLVVYGLMHFVVDFSCFYYLIGTFALHQHAGISFVNGLVLYNMLAFGLQFIIGGLYDRRSHRSAGLIGVGLIMAGLLIKVMLSGDHIVILILIAVGNAFFHVAGGIDSLVNSKGRMARSGAFVSTGALGVSLGTYVGKNSLIGIATVLMVLLLGFIGIVLFGDAKSTVEQKEIDRGESSLLLGVCCCFIAIVMRSYVGMSHTVILHTLFLGAICTMFGKLAGGIAADKFGGKRVGVGALLIAAFCYALGDGNALLSIIGIITFNMAMPITLYGLYEYFPNHPGFAFGLSTLALLAGYVGYAALSVGTGIVRIIILVLFTALMLGIGVPGKKSKETA